MGASKNKQAGVKAGKVTARVATGKSKPKPAKKKAGKAKKRE
jgi:hypothetical protein